MLCARTYTIGDDDDDVYDDMVYNHAVMTNVSGGTSVASLNEASLTMTGNFIIKYYENFNHK